MPAIHGVVQHYAWGDLSAIPSLLGREPDGTPWAEWWLGTHPGGPSTLADGQPLVEVSGDLPYLVKLLAAADSLSLQTHPDAATARAGFERENAAGLAIDDARRIYRDPNAKPEILCALTAFDALCGFRPVDASLTLLHAVGATELAAQLHDHGIAHTVEALYRRTFPIAATVAACATSDREEALLVGHLAERYPDDPSVVVTLLLNRVHLHPGEAIHLTPGNLHAYLHGFGVEVMGASDNVVRGGLTPKHVDVDELLRVLSYEPIIDPVVRPTPQAGTDDSRSTRWHYATPSAPFALTRLDVADTLSYVATSREVLLCTAAAEGTSLRRGDAMYVAPGEQVDIAGTCTVYRTESAGH